MSVITAAEAYVDEASKEIDTALRKMSEVVILRCSGWDEYNVEAKKNYREIFDMLIEIRDLFEKVGR